MVKLCNVATVPFTVRVFLLEQLDYLAHNGFAVSVICNEDPVFRQDLPATISYRPIQMDRTTSMGSTWLSLWQMYRLFAAEKFDIIQYQTPKAALLASIAGWITGVPVRLYCQWGIRYVGLHGWKRYIFQFFERLTCLLSTHISPDSKGNLEFSVQEGLYTAEKASVVHFGSANGVDMDRFAWDQKDEWRRDARSELGIGAADMVFGFVGRLNRDKGINELVEVFLQLAQGQGSVHLLLIGPMEEQGGLDPAVLQAIDSRPDIHYLGERWDVEKFYAVMDAFVLPSYREGFGSVLLEAQAMAVPVISTDIPGPREAIVDGETGLLIPPRDTEALRAAMLRLCEDPKLRTEMGNAGRDFVDRRFRQSNFWPQVLLHRRKLLGEKCQEVVS